LFPSILIFFIYMKVSVIQANLIWENRDANLAKFEKLIGPLYNKTDIVVLPEMFTTGFSMRPELFCEMPHSETYKWMKHISDEGNMAVCGSYIIKEDEKCFNRWVFVSPETEDLYYDKRHLFSIGGEEKHFSHGMNRLVFEFRGFRILPNICYDLRFPVWSRNRNDYDLLINSANWPESRREVWNTLLRARAIENQCYAAGVNRIGTDGAGIKYHGESLIINYKGEVLNSGADYSECIITTELSIKELNAFRNKFPAWKDADNFSITT
jgi:omega-amidase